MSHYYKIEGDAIPPAFGEIPDPPKQLYVEGHLPAWRDYAFLTVVGSRQVTDYGRDVCELLIKSLRGYPVVIVSGLALGIDTIAHKTALTVGLPTVAFPGSGFQRQVLYPASNIDLADEIVAQGGALISEQSPDTKGAIYMFPRRNRLIAGLSRATLIIEAGEKSGTLITARLALDYNRDVLAVPGSILSPNSDGTNQLIRSGATPITSGDDLLEALGFERQDLEPDSGSSLNRAKLLATLDPIEQKIVTLLATNPLSRDEIIRLLQLSTAEANYTLTMMEIKGLLKNSFGEMRLGIKF